MCRQIQEVFDEAHIQAHFFKGRWCHQWHLKSRWFRKCFECWCELRTVSAVTQRSLFPWSLLKGEGFPPVWQHFELIFLRKILHIMFTSIMKCVTAKILTSFCVFEFQGEVFVLYQATGEHHQHQHHLIYGYYLGRGASIQTFTGLLWDTLLSSMWKGFPKSGRLLPKRETSSFQAQWEKNRIIFLIKMNNVTITSVFMSTLSVPSFENTATV